jgi:hypothetical protein
LPIAPQLGHIAGQPLDHAHQQRDRFIHARPRLAESGIKIAAPVDLDLDAVDAFLAPRMPLQHVAAGIRPVVRRQPRAAAKCAKAEATSAPAQLAPNRSPSTNSGAGSAPQ